MIRITVPLTILKTTWMLYLAFFIPGWINAQKWQNLQIYGGSGDENPGDLYCNPNGQCVLGFTFQNQVTIDGKQLNSEGGSDFVILRRLPGSTRYQYFSHGGGPLNEEIMAVRTQENGGVICAGIFWRELVLPDTTLKALDAGKAIFVLSYFPNGQLQWAKVLNGTGLKSVSDVLLNNNGHIWVSGYFGDTLYVEDKKWASKGQTDLFLLRLEADGHLLWLQQHGILGNTRLAAIAELPGRAVVGLGYFDDRVSFGNTQFTANTKDQDLFLTAWGPDGQILWTQKGGGVYDATPVDIATDDKGRIYFSGNIVGVIRFDNGLSIQSKDGNSDVFLGGCTSAGTPLWARVYTGEQVQECTRLLWQNQSIYLSGYTLGKFEWGGKTIQPPNFGSHSFLGTLDTLGRPLDVQVLTAENGLFTGGLAYAPGSQLQLAGVYKGTGKLEGFELPTTSNFDFFTADFSSLATGIKGISVNDPRFKVFPIPSKSHLFIENHDPREFMVTLTDALGREVLKKPESPQALDLSGLEKGLYFLKIRQQGQDFIYKVLKQ